MSRSGIFYDLGARIEIIVVPNLAEIRFQGLIKLWNLVESIVLGQSKPSKISGLLGNAFR